MVLRLVNRNGGSLSLPLLSYCLVCWASIDPRGNWSLRSSLGRPQADNDPVNSSKPNGTSSFGSSRVQSLDRLSEIVSLTACNVHSQDAGDKVVPGDTSKSNELDVHAQSGRDSIPVVVVDPFDKSSSAAVPTDLSVSGGSVPDNLSSPDCASISLINSACDHAEGSTCTSAPFLDQAGSLLLETRREASPVLESTRPLVPAPPPLSL